MKDEFVITQADHDDMLELSEFAARTFPLACPPALPHADIAAFIESDLSGTSFARYLTDSHRTVWLLWDTATPRQLAGYAMTRTAHVSDPQLSDTLPADILHEINKFYVDPALHHQGVATVLMTHVLNQWRSTTTTDLSWLGVNQYNNRAIRFYQKHGFTVAGTRTFRVGTFTNDDYIMVQTR